MKALLLGMATATAAIAAPDPVARMPRGYTQIAWYDESFAPMLKYFARLKGAPPLSLIHI